MISKFETIQQFGILREFTWNDQPEFTKRNIIYGWNYSGKTTLSRVFGCIETKQKHKDYGVCKIGFVSSQGKNYDCDSWDSFPYNVKVFNGDFIRKNIHWDDNFEPTGFAPILIVGEENIELQQSLSAAERELQSKVDSIKIKEERYDSDIRDRDKLLSQKAQMIKNGINLPDYNRTKLKDLINHIGTNVFLLNTEELQKHQELYRSIDKKEKLPKIFFQFPEIRSVSLKAYELLGEKVKSGTIQKLKDNPNLNNWVRIGKALHEGVDVCQFCNNPLPDGLLTELAAHFSDEYEKHLTEIEQTISRLHGMKITIDLFDPAKPYNEFIEEYSSYRENTITAIADHNGKIDEVVDKLKAKKEKPLIPLQYQSIVFNDDILRLLDLVNAIIEKHNKKTDNFDKNKQTSLDLLLKHYASEVVIDSTTVRLSPRKR